MNDDQQSLRDWHRLFGLLLTDFFTDSPFDVELERDLSEQQQFLDVIILRRGRGKMISPLPDGLGDLLAHNLVTFKSHHEVLDSWAMKELVGHYVAYRKLVSPRPSRLLPEADFRLYAICARFPNNLSNQVELRQELAGVYHCQWGTDIVRVIVAGELPKEAHNAPLQLFSASRELVGFASSSYERHSERTSGVLQQLFDRFEGEGLVMPYTIDDFERDYVKEHLPKLSREQRREVFDSCDPEVLQQALESLPLEKRLAGFSEAEIREYLNQVAARRKLEPRKPRKKK